MAGVSFFVGFFDVTVTVTSRPRGRRLVSSRSIAVCRVMEMSVAARECSRFSVSIEARSDDRKIKDDVDHLGNRLCVEL